MHKWAEAFALGYSLKKAQASLNNLILKILVFSATFPFGEWIG